jgi:hypothetical protein
VSSFSNRPGPKSLFWWTIHGTYICTGSREGGGCQRTRSGRAGNQCGLHDPPTLFHFAAAVASPPKHSPPSRGPHTTLTGTHTLPHPRPPSRSLSSPYPPRPAGVSGLTSSLVYNLPDTRRVPSSRVTLSLAHRQAGLMSYQLGVLKKRNLLHSHRPHPLRLRCLLGSLVYGVYHSIVNRCYGV